MLNYTTISPLFVSKLGFRQVRDNCVPALHPDLLKGTYFVHGVKEAANFLTPETIYNTVEEFEATKNQSVLAWSNVTTYTKGSKVSYSITVNGNPHTFYFYSLQANNTNHVPAFDSAWWESDLSNYLRNAVMQSTMECITEIVTGFNVEKNLRNTLNFAPIFEERSMLVKQDRDAQGLDRFRGLRISLASLRDLKVILSHIGIKFAEAQEPFNLYLYHSSQPTAIQTFPITYAVANTFSWIELKDNTTDQNPCVLSYVSDTLNNGGVFYLGYYENDTTGDLLGFQAFKKTIPDCPQSYIMPAIFENSQIDNPNIPTLGEFYTPAISEFYTPFNVKVTTAFDYTSTVKQSQEMFCKPIQYDVACKILIDMDNSMRLNREKDGLRNKINEILYGKTISDNKTLLPKTIQGLAEKSEGFRNQAKLDLSYKGGNPMSNNWG